MAFPYAIPMLIAAAVSAAIAIPVIRYREAPGAVPLAALLVAAALWAAGGAFQRASAGLAAKVFWIRIQYLGIAVVPTAWVVFVLQYTGQGRWVNRRTLALLSVKPLATVALIYTNDAHHLFWAGFDLETVGGHAMAVSTYAAGFWIHAAYDYLLLSVGTVLLVGLYVLSEHVYRGQAAALLFASGVPWVANVAFISGAAPAGFDPTPIGFIVTGIVLAGAILRTRLLEVVPAVRTLGRNEFIENMPDAVVIIDGDGHVVDLNPAAEAALGVTAADAVGRTLDGVFPDLADVIHSDEPVEVHLEADGEFRWYDARSSPLRRAKGTLTGRVVTLRDVTDRHRREEQVTDLHEATRDLIRAPEEEAVAEVAVRAVRDILGFPLCAVWLYDGDAKALRPVAKTPESDGMLGEIPTFEAGESLSWRAFRTGEVEVYDDVGSQPGAYNPDTPIRSEIILPLGEYGVMNVGSPTEESVDGIDVTLARTLAAHTEAALEQVDREAELRDERAFIEVALDSLGDIFYVVDADGRLVRWNEPATRVTGYTDEELSEIDPMDLFAGEDADRVQAAMAEAFEGGGTTVEADIVTKDGKTVPYELRGERLIDGEGDLIGIVGIGRDVTDRRRRRQQIEVMGRLLRHNLRNEMNVVQGHAELLADRIADRCLAEYADEIGAIVDRVMCRSEKLSWVEHEWTDPAPVDAVDVVSDVIETARRTYPDARITADLPDGMRVGGGSTVEIAVEELVANAIEHHPDESAARVEVAADYLDERRMIRIEVADNGPGIPAMERTPIEEGEETPVDHGSGIGLWIVAWSVQNAGGELDFDVDEDGTTVRVLLPAAEGAGDRAIGETEVNAD